MRAGILDRWGCPDGVAPPASSGGTGAPSGGGSTQLTTRLVAILLGDTLATRRGRNLRTSIFSTVAGRGTARILRGRRQVATKTFAVREGKTSLSLPTRTLRAGRYTVSLAVTAGGQTSTDTTRLNINRR